MVARLATARAKDALCLPMIFFILGRFSDVIHAAFSKAFHTVTLVALPLMELNVLFWFSQVPLKQMTDNPPPTFATFSLVLPLDAPHSAYAIANAKCLFVRLSVTIR